MNRPLRVWGFGTYDTSRHPRAGIVLAGLRAHGVEVRELTRPLGFTTAERVDMLGHPWLLYRLAFRLVSRWVALARIARRALRTETPDAVVVGYLGHFDVLLARALFGRRARIVLDLMIFAADTARDRGATGGVKLRVLAALDRLAVRACDVIMLDTDEHAELLSGRDRTRAVVVPVGAAPEWFEARPPAHADGPLRVVFYGLFTPLQGAVTIAAALGRLAGTGIEATMVGRGQDLAEARRAAAGNPDIDWRDWVEAAQLPELVAGHDVCVGIVGTTPKAFRVVPNKVFQGAAAGCAVVTSDTAAQCRALGDAAVFVPAGDPALLADALVRLAHDRDLLDSVRAACAKRADDYFAPDAVVAPLLTSLTHPKESR